MSHYIAIFVEDHVGEWRGVFPDVPGCEARGFTLDDAQFAAARALSRWLREYGTLPALPMNYGGSGEIYRLAGEEPHRPVQSRCNDDFYCR